MKETDTKKIAFFDRDGVINKKAAPHAYITKADKFVFNPGSVDLLRDLIKNGYEIIIVSNQRGVARGFMTEQDLQLLHIHMLKELEKQGVKILDIFYCPHEKNSCDCRKPKPGLLWQAVEKYEIDLQNSVFITDSEDEVIMGKTFGIGKNILVPQNHPEKYYEQKN